MAPAHAVLADFMDCQEDGGDRHPRAHVRWQTHWTVYHWGRIWCQNGVQSLFDLRQSPCCWSHTTRAVTKVCIQIRSH